MKIRIPATSANLGAGFDALGLAVSLYNYVNIEESDEVKILSLDHIPIPTDKSNLIYSSAEILYQHCGKKLKGMYIEQVNHIPLTRGLGSSSACIIAGLTAANELLGKPLNVDDMVNLAAQIEGHPDNTTPALLGGIVTSVFDGTSVHYVRQEVDSTLHFYAMIPDFELKTEIARGCLPKEIPHKDAVFNLSRAALFSSSLLTGKYQNLKIAVEDSLHQPYRIPLIAHAKEVFEAAYQNGAYAVYISGAGPTIMAIVDNNNFPFEKNMREFLDTAGLETWLIENLTIDNDGTKII